jgi:cystathionine beta-lyase
LEFDFDVVIDRVNTNSLKYDFARERGKPEGLLPLWVADMDFRIAPGIADAVRKTADHGIYGYTEVKQPYYDALSGWFESRFDYAIPREYVMKTPGIVFALALAVRAFTNRGDAVLIQKPVYYPFPEVIEANGREIVSNSLVLRDGRYEIDFDDFERKIADNHIKLFLFCSPHNPVGRVWTREELLKIGEITAKHGCLVVSDEIHCDFVLPGHRHYIYSSLSVEMAQNSIICLTPTKSFNIAGLQVGNLIIPNADIKQKMKSELDKTGYSQLNTVTLAAGQAAYETGGEWFDAVWRYILQNLNYVRDFLRENLPGIKLIEPEGTYLLWLDCRECGVEPEKLDSFITEKARLWTDDGCVFGPEGRGFQRINIACPRATIVQAMTQLKEAFDGLR